MTLSSPVAFYLLPLVTIGAVIIAIGHLLLMVGSLNDDMNYGNIYTFLIASFYHGTLCV